MLRGRGPALLGYVNPLSYVGANAYARHSMINGHP